MPFQRIRDPLHNLIEFDVDDEVENALWETIKSRPFQRLRRVKQLGFSDLVYPGATHSRFIHSLGVFHTARRLMDVIRRDVKRLEQSKVTRALAAALVHDVGHGPFSHAFEAVGRRLGLKLANHENVSDMLVRDSEITTALNVLGGGFAGDVADIISGRGENNIYRAVVSSQFDADRLDYMRRDRLMTGTQNSAIDFEWLLANLEVGEVEYGVDDVIVGKVQTFVLKPKALYAAEAFVLGLFQLYPTVYFHKATRGAEKIYTELLVRLIQIIRDGSVENTGLPTNHPIVKFAMSPDDVEGALALDDSVVWGSLCLTSEAKDCCVSQLATRLRDRKLFKCVDIRSCIAHEKGDLEAYSAKADKVCESAKQKLNEWTEAHSSDVPRILIDEEKRSPYKRITESKGPLDQINIKTDGGFLVDLSQRSKVVSELETFRLLRAYAAEEDTEARSAITAIITSEMTAWPQ